MEGKLKSEEELGSALHKGKYDPGRFCLFCFLNDQIWAYLNAVGQDRKVK